VLFSACGAWAFLKAKEGGGVNRVQGPCFGAGTYDESVFKAFDYIIAQAGFYKIKVRTPPYFDKPQGCPP